MKGYIWLVVFVLLPGFSFAKSEITGFAALEYRQFMSGDKYRHQELGSGPAFILEPEYYYVSPDDRDVFTTRIFVQSDLFDDERTSFDIRQLDFVRADGDWEIKLGISKVFWGVTESNHLVDIINQTDAVQDTDGEDKLGQPMVQYARFFDWGTVRLFYLPYFRERTFPGKHGRLRSSILVDTDNPIYANGKEEFHPDFAARYTHTIGDWDIGLAHFHGTSREPVLRLNGQVFRPFYEIIDQTSLDVQYTYDAWLIKLEAITRGGQGKYFAATSGGFEYSFYGIFETDYDLGVLLEYHRDGRDYRAPAAILDNDIFAGARLVFNDTEDTEILAGIVTDISDQSKSVNIEAARRLTSRLKLEADIRLLMDQDAESPLYQIRRDDFAQVKISYFF